jgi:hypothetical protein
MVGLAKQVDDQSALHDGSRVHHLEALAQLRHHREVVSYVEHAHAQFVLEL